MGIEIIKYTVLHIDKPDFDVGIYYYSVELEFELEITADTTEEALTKWCRDNWLDNNWVLVGDNGRVLLFAGATDEWLPKKVKIMR